MISAGENHQLEREKMKSMIALLALSFVIASCGDQDDGTCTPGSVQDCVCLGGGKGEQVCNQDGQSWGECDCTEECDTDIDTDVDTDEDTLPPTTMTDCAGGKLDQATNLCWQDPPSDSHDVWNHAVNTCDNLVRAGHNDWRLPNIDELISLIRGCLNGMATGDLSPSTCEMTPEGCTVVDSCSGVINNWSCPWLKGPGGGWSPDPDGGCYWDPAFDGACGGYWSSSTRVNTPSEAWVVDFGRGNVYDHGKSSQLRTRCVRNGP